MLPRTMLQGVISGGFLFSILGHIWFIWTGIFEKRSRCYFAKAWFVLHVSMCNMHQFYFILLFYFIIPIAATVAKLTTDQASCNVAKIWDSSMFTKMHQNCFFVKNNKKNASLFKNGMKTIWFLYYTIIESAFNHHHVYKPVKYHWPLWWDVIN